MSIAIKRLERAIGDLPKGGMQTGSHKVKLDLSDAERLIVELNAIQAERDALLVYAIDAEKWFNKHDPHGYVSPKRADIQTAISAHDAEVAAKAIEDALDACRHTFNYGDVPVSELVDYVEQLRTKK